jgi:hypothetical protein
VAHVVRSTSFSRTLYAQPPVSTSMWSDASERPSSASAYTMQRNGHHAACNVHHAPLRTTGWGPPTTTQAIRARGHLPTAPSRHAAAVQSQSACSAAQCSAVQRSAAIRSAQLRLEPVRPLRSARDLLGFTRGRASLIASTTSRLIASWSVAARSYAASASNKPEARTTGGTAEPPICVACAGGAEFSMHRSLPRARRQVREETNGAAVRTIGAQLRPSACCAAPPPKSGSQRAALRRRWPINTCSSSASLQFRL